MCASHISAEICPEVCCKHEHTEIQIWTPRGYRFSVRCVEINCSYSCLFGVPLNSWTFVALLALYWWHMCFRQLSKREKNDSVVLWLWAAMKTVGEGEQLLSLFDSSSANWRLDSKKLHTNTWCVCVCVCGCCLLDIYKPLSVCVLAFMLFSCSWHCWRNRCYLLEVFLPCKISVVA